MKKIQKNLKIGKYIFNETELEQGFCNIFVHQDNYFANKEFESLAFSTDVYWVSFYKNGKQNYARVTEKADVTNSWICSYELNYNL